MSSPTTLDEARQVMPPIWVIYRHPADHPRHYVVRVWFGLFADERVTLAHDLEGARRAVQQAGASVHMPRSERDEPVIVETWI